MGQQRKGRKWFVLMDDFADEVSFREAVCVELAKLENMGYRLARGFIAAPIREQVGPESYETTGWMFEDVFVPAVRQPLPADPEDARAELADEPLGLSEEELAAHFPGREEPVEAA